MKGTVKALPGQVESYFAAQAMAADVSRPYRRRRGAMAHEFLSPMPNVRRAGVAVATQAFEQAVFVNGRRDVIRLADRRALENFVTASYGGPEAVYERLIG